METPFFHLLNETAAVIVLFLVAFSFPTLHQPNHLLCLLLQLNGWNKSNNIPMISTTNPHIQTLAKPSALMEILQFPSWLFLLHFLQRPFQLSPFPLPLPLTHTSLTPHSLQVTSLLIPPRKLRVRMVPPT